MASRPQMLRPVDGTLLAVTASEWTRINAEGWQLSSPLKAWGATKPSQSMRLNVERVGRCQG